MSLGSHYRPRIPGSARCTDCGDPFPATRKDARFCSPACRQASSRRSRFIARVKSILVSPAPPELARKMEPPIARLTNNNDDDYGPQERVWHRLPVTDNPPVSQNSGLKAMAEIPAAIPAAKKSVTADPPAKKSVTAVEVKKKTSTKRPSAKMTSAARTTTKKSVTLSKAAKRPAKGKTLPKKSVTKKGR